MKKEVMLFFILIIFLPIANAQTKIFSGKVITDTDKVIDGGIFRFRYDETSNKVFVQTPATGLIVENGACKSNNFFRVCINRANFSYKNITTYVYSYEIDATIYKLTSSLSTSSKALSELLQKESSEFTITITNPSDFDITNINYNEDFSPFSITDVKGCTLEGTQLKWQGSLQSKYDKTCTVTITAEKEGTFSLVGNLSYFNGYETENKTTDTITIKVLPKQLKVSQLFDKNIEVNQPFYINTSLQNINKNEKIEALVTIELPSNIALLKDVTGFNKDFNILKQSLILEQNAIFNYSLYLEATVEGTNPIKQKFDYTIKNTRDIIENNTFVNPIEPKPIINFTAEYAELTPGQEFIVIVRLKNPSKVHELTDFKARLIAPYNNEIVQSVNKLIPNESYPIISNTLVLPKGLAEDKFKLDFNVEYKLSGIAKSLNKSLELKIKGANITVPTKSEIQKPEEKIEKTVENKTAEHVVIESLKQKSGLLQNIKIILIIFVAITILAITPIIYKIKKRKKSNELKEGSLRDLKGNIPKE